MELSTVPPRLQWGLERKSVYVDGKIVASSLPLSGVGKVSCECCRQILSFLFLKENMHTAQFSTVLSLSPPRL